MFGHAEYVDLTQYLEWKWYSTVIYAWGLR